MRIGEVATLTGLEASTIRFYEKQGVFPPPDRTEAGYRDYGEDDVELMRFVHRLRSLELPLDDISQIVALRTAGRAPCPVVRQALIREATAIGDRIRQLEGLGEELGRLRDEAERIRDDWPISCVCHVVSGSSSDEDS